MADYNIKWTYVCDCSDIINTHYTSKYLVRKREMFANVSSRKFYRELIIQHFMSLETEYNLMGKLGLFF